MKNYRPDLGELPDNDPVKQWKLLIVSFAGMVWHPVEVISFGPIRSKVRFLDDNIKGKKGSVHSVPTGALKSYEH